MEAARVVTGLRPVPRKVRRFLAFQFAPESFISPRPKEGKFSPFSFSLVRETIRDGETTARK
jgi:hypothetical protein